jgi:hypothetical protein
MCGREEDGNPKIVILHPAVEEPFEGEVRETGVEVAGVGAAGRLGRGLVGEREGGRGGDERGDCASESEGRRG